MTLQELRPARRRLGQFLATGALATIEVAASQWSMS